jgi:hypothetical protein
MSVTKLIALSVLLFSGAVGGALFFVRLVRHQRDPTQPWKPWLWVGILLADGVMFLALWYGFVFADPPDFFFRALRDDDLEAAYALLSYQLQEELGGQPGFEDWAEAITPQRWFFNAACSSGARGRIDGSGRFELGERFSVSFHVLRLEGEWVIQGITFWELPDAYRVGRSSGLDCSD